MRALAFVLGALVATACSPDITSGTYYCGDEQACPPELSCDGPTAQCVYPQDVEVFECPAGSNDAEPDDDVAAAADLGVGGCGAIPVTEVGCIDAGGDVDHATLTIPSSCPNGLDLKLRYPLAFMPLQLELLDADGTLVEAGTICAEADTSAQVTTCLSASVEPDTTYVIRVRPADDAPDCDGACAYNRYQLSIL
jgi:hypothetical protein